MGTKQSKVQFVYNILLNDIIAQKYNQGDRLIISQIAEQCKVSDTPVREALYLLDSEGYIKINANQGATVIGFTKKNLKDISEIKGVLEGYATRLSIDYLSPYDIRRLYSMNQQLREAAAQGDDIRFSELNNLFHESIYRHTPKAELLSLIHQLWKKWQFTAQVFSMVPERMMSSCEEHDNILKLIEEKDYDQVELVVRQHKMAALTLWSQSLPEGPEE